MRLRVLHIGKFFPPYLGGMETALADLVAEQQAQSVQVKLLVHGQPLSQDPDWLVRVPVQVQLVYAPVALGFRSALAKVIEEFKPDLLHLHMPNTSVFWCLTLASAKRIPWVVHWHSDVVASRIRTTLRIAYTAYRPFEQAVLETAERIVATSPPYLEASEPLSHWRDKCAVVPLGLGASAPITPEPSTGNPWRTQGLRLLSIGRLAYYKGFETLIRAVATMPGVELVIVGDGELRQELTDLCGRPKPDGQLPQVRLLGSVSDEEKYALLSTCDVFCLASRERTEAFGMVLLEAMYMSKPCIVSDLEGSGMPWVVASSHAGLLVEPENITAWQNAIRELQNDAPARMQMGAAGNQAVMHQFSAHTSAKALYQQYLLALAESLPAALEPPCETQVGASNDARAGVLIVIPAKNEAATIAIVVRDLLNAGWRDVVVVDDLSDDGTGAVAREAGARVLRPVLALGAWGGMQTGIRYGLAHGFGTVVTMDADGQHEVEEIPTLLSQRLNADVVIGAHPQRASRLRHIAWSWFRRLTGLDFNDLTSGFRLYNREAMELVTTPAATMLDYQDLGALLLLRQARKRIVEVPVSMNNRAVGKSRIFNSWYSVGRYMLATTLLCVVKN